MRLCIAQERFDVTHYRLYKLVLVQQAAVPVGKLLFPVQLLFCQNMLFKRMVRFDDDQWSRRFETYATFDTDNGVAYVNIAANSEWLCNLSQLLNCGYRVVKSLAGNAF